MKTKKDGSIMKIRCKEGKGMILHPKEIFLWNFSGEETKEYVSIDLVSGDTSNINSEYFLLSPKFFKITLKRDKQK